MSLLAVYFDMKYTFAEFFSQKFEYQRCFRTQPNNPNEFFFLQKYLTAFSS